MSGRFRAQLRFEGGDDLGEPRRAFHRHAAPQAAIPLRRGVQTLEMRVIVENWFGLAITKNLAAIGQLSTAVVNGIASTVWLEATQATRGFR